MFDELREDINDRDVFDLDDPFEYYEDLPPQRGFLGLTAGQRFILALLLFATVIVMGVTFLIVTGRIVLPIP